jgi:hypothetical protein
LVSVVAEEVVEFGKEPVEVGGFKKFTDHLRGVYRI